MNIANRNNTSPGATDTSTGLRNVFRSPTAKWTPSTVGEKFWPWCKVNISPGNVSSGVGARLSLHGPRHRIIKAALPVVYDRRSIQRLNEHDSHDDNFYLQSHGVDKRSDFIHPFWMSALFYRSTSPVWSPIILPRCML